MPLHELHEIYMLSMMLQANMTREKASENVTLRVIEKKNLGAKHCVLSARWDYKQHRFQDFFFRQHRFRNATLGGISNTRSKERSEAL
jgi:hypothetical protein